MNELDNNLSRRKELEKEFALGLSRLHEMVGLNKNEVMQEIDKVRLEFQAFSKETEKKIPVIVDNAINQKYSGLRLVDNQELITDARNATMSRLLGTPDSPEYILGHICYRGCLRRDFRKRFPKYKGIWKRVTTEDCDAVLRFIENYHISQKDYYDCFVRREKGNGNYQDPDGYSVIKRNYIMAKDRILKNGATNEDVKYIKAYEKYMSKGRISPDALGHLVNESEEYMFGNDDTRGENK